MSKQQEKELPSGWKRVKLSDIAQINPPLDRCIVNDSVAVDFIPMRAVEPEGGGLLRPEVSTYGKVKKGYTAFVKGDVIMAKITPCMENGKTCIVPELPGAACFGSTEFHVVRVEDGIDARWINYFLLQHSTRHIAQRQMAGGVGQMRVSSAFLEALEVPVPPEKEQVRIADALDELLSDLDAGIATLEQIQAKLKPFRAAVLKAAVEGALTAEWRTQHTDVESASILLVQILATRRRLWEEMQLEKFQKAGKELPRNWKGKYTEPTAPDTTKLSNLPTKWCWATVEQCSALIQYGTSAKTNGDSSGIPVLRMGNIETSGVIDLLDLKYLPSTHDEFPSLLLQEGDLLFNRTNSAELVGKTGLYRGIPSPCSFASYLIRVKLLDGVSPAIVSFALNGGGGKKWIKTVVTQMVGQANVNGSKLSAFIFPLAPKVEQATVVESAEAQLSVIDHLEADLAAKLKSAQALRQSILRDAFAGKLVPQDPNDEPATELLARIAAERAELTWTTRSTKPRQARSKRVTKPRRRTDSTESFL